MNQGPPPGAPPAMPKRLLAYFQGRKRPTPIPAERERQEGGGRKPSAYGRTALVRELEALRQAKEGTRNHTLNRAAWMLARLVPTGDLDARGTARALYRAALSTGLEAHESERTIRGAFGSRGVTL